MRTLIGICLLLTLGACADNPHRATDDSAKRMLAQQCPSGTVESPPGSGFCDPVNQRQQGPLRQTVGGALSQPMPSAPSVGGIGLRR